MSHFAALFVVVVILNAANNPILINNKSHRCYSAATKAGLDEECDVTDIGDISPECVDYGKFLDELFVLRDLLAADASKGGSTKKMSLADVLKNVKLSAPTEGAPGEHNNSPELATALADAKKATAKYGITSPEAKLAWETYEDIASTGTSNAVGVNLMEECSIESGQDACKAMEELERVMPVLLAISMTN